MGDVRAQRRHDVQAKQLPLQGRHPRTSSRGVQHHHRTGIDQAVHGERNQTGGPARLTVRPYKVARVLVGHHGSDGGDADYGCCGRPPDDPISRGHRRPPPSANSQVKRHRLGFLVQSVRTKKTPPAAALARLDDRRLAAGRPHANAGQRLRSIFSHRGMDHKHIRDAALVHAVLGEIMDVPVVVQGKLGCVDRGLDGGVTVQWN
jgi:hypothetical protein